MTESANIDGSVWGRWRWLTLSMMALWITIVAISLITVNALAERLTSIAHTHNVIGSLHAIQSRITDVETAQRGYILNGRKEYLDPMIGAEDDLDHLLGQLKHLTRDNSAQQAELERLEPMVHQRLDLSRAIIAGYDTSGVAAARLISNGRAKAMHDAIRQKIATMEKVEQALLEERETQAAQSRDHLNWSIGFALSLLGGCIVLS